MAIGRIIPQPEPLYEQVHEVLRARIAAGEWKPREPMPGEVSLSHELGVSIGTVRKAMERLRRENVVIRERGRGTFVRAGSDWRAGSLFRLRDKTGRAIGAEISVVASSSAIASLAEARLFRPDERSPARLRLTKLSREWRQKGVLVCRETVGVDETRLPGLAQASGLTAESLLDLYAELYRIKTNSVRWEIGGCSGDLSSTFAASSGPRVKITRFAFDARGAAIEICEQTLVLDEFSVESRVFAA